MKKCTTKPGQNYPRVLTFTTNTPERGLHLLEYKESWTPAQNLPEQSTKTPFMVLICCRLCSFAYRLGGFFQVKADTTNSTELSSSSEWSCCDGCARLPVDLPSILVPPMEEIQRTYLFNMGWEYSLATTKEVWKQSRYLRRVVCVCVCCVCVCVVCMCVSGVRVCTCVYVHVRVCECVSFHSWLYEEGQKAWMQWNGQGLSSVTSVY